LDIDNPDIPFPHVDCVANIQEFLLAMQLEILQRLRSRGAAEAVELLAVDAKDVIQVAAPAQDGAEDFVKFDQFQIIRDRDQADDHGAQVARNHS
jgi:hypothetical protein